MTYRLYPIFSLLIGCASCAGQNSPSVEDANTPVDAAQEIVHEDVQQDLMDIGAVSLDVMNSPTLTDADVVPPQDIEDATGVDPDGLRVPSKDIEELTGVDGDGLSEEDGADGEEDAVAEPDSDPWEYVSFAGECPGDPTCANTFFKDVSAGMFHSCACLLYTSPSPRDS